jgi:hypothetical protein
MSGLNYAFRQSNGKSTEPFLFWMLFLLKQIGLQHFFSWPLIFPVLKAPILKLLKQVLFLTL